MVKEDADATVALTRVMQVEEIKEFTVRDRLGPLTLKGQILADFRYGREDKPRWTDMALYRIVPSGEALRAAEALEEHVLRELTPTEREAVDPVLPRLLRLLEERQPTYQYAVEIIARSYVYHRAKGPCAKTRHRVTTVGNVRQNNHRWRNLVECPKCKPDDLEYMPADAQIAEESEEAFVYLCANAHEIAAKLYHRNGEISAMAAKMVRAASKRDQGIAQMMRASRRV